MKTGHSKGIEFSLIPVLENDLLHRSRIREIFSTHHADSISFDRVEPERFNEFLKKIIDANKIIPHMHFITIEGEIVGIIGVSEYYKKDKVVVIYIFLYPDIQSLGIGKLCVSGFVNYIKDVMKPNAIVIETTIDNIPMQRIAERLGFNIKNNITKNGKEMVSYMLVINNIVGLQQKDNN